MFSVSLSTERDTLQRILDAVETIIVVLDPQGCVIRINRFGAKTLGRPAHEIVGQPWFLRFVPQPEGMERVYPVFLSVMQGQLAGAEYFENDIVTAGGLNRTIAWHSTYMRDADGTIIGTLSAGNDITDQKRLQETLQLRCQELQRAQSVSKVGSWQWDIPSDTVTWSDENCRIFGLAPGTPVRSDTFFNLLHPDDRSRVEALWAQAIQDKAYFAEHRIVAAGQVKWVQGRAKLEYAADGSLQVAYGTTWDITERKLADLELREARAHNEVVREEERLHIALELHDELGQALTAIKLNLSRLEARVAKHDAELARQLAELTGQTAEAMQAVRRIAQELRPPALANGDLCGAIALDVDKLRKQLGIRCRLTRPVEGIELPERLKTHVYRICQEALTNIARHARATRVDVSITSSPTELVLVVTDDGTGMPPGAWTGTTLGLVGMQERARDIGGSLETLTRPDYAGTQITLRVKRPAIVELKGAP